MGASVQTNKHCVRLAHFGLLAAALGCFLLHADAAVQQPAAFCSRAAAAAAFTEQIYNECVGAAAGNPQAEQLLRAFRTAWLHSRSPAD